MGSVLSECQNQPQQQQQRQSDFKSETFHTKLNSKKDLSLLSGTYKNHHNFFKRNLSCTSDQNSFQDCQLKLSLQYPKKNQQKQTQNQTISTLQRDYDMQQSRSVMNTQFTNYDFKNSLETQKNNSLKNNLLSPIKNDQIFRNSFEIQNLQENNQLLKNSFGKKHHSILKRRTSKDMRRKKSVQFDENTQVKDIPNIFLQQRLNKLEKFPTKKDQQKNYEIENFCENRERPIKDILGEKEKHQENQEKLKHHSSIQTTNKTKQNKNEISFTEVTAWLIAITFIMIYILYPYMQIQREELHYDEFDFTKEYYYIYTQKNY